MRMNMNNPVLVKEVKLRFRSLKSFTGILFYLIAMSIFVFGFIFLTTAFTGTGFFRPEESFFLFGLLTFIQLGLILFITPGLTAGTISTEREKQTLNILLTTSQSSMQIILGKLSSSIAFLVLMLIAGLPIYSLVFLFGGISPGQLGLIFLFFFLTMLTVGSIGVMFSTITRKTIVSMIATYGTMIFLAGVTAFFFMITIQVNMLGSGVTQSPSPLAHFWASINPGILIFSLLNPMTEDFVNEATKIDFPVWAGYTIFYVLLAASAITISIKKLRVNMKKQK
ncbi:ABC transporter permease [Paenisporosarcina quisquiliarum]|uniref:ABC transporter permease n=1 Tax=Paenisporosarcina quisquiliarum TaxID=365346 RepID=A0A9X3LEF1_9BACL|nr:ABC transporter permease subunit [Paenisporosarcina quisquiliarum]MCZ8536480.1 ABC transporter permease [Paenisporosarcina quisquiliarum]